MTFSKTLKPVVRRLGEEELLPVFSHVWSKWPYKDRMPEPVNVEYLAKSWASLMRLGNASAYATFRNGEANGVLLGLFTPDLYTGNLQGVEFLWAGRDTKSMLKEFESDCKEKGCKQIICGISCDVMGDRVPVLRRFYRQNGYAPVKEAFSKRL